MGTYIFSIIIRLSILGLWLWKVAIPLYLEKEGGDNFPSKEKIVYSEGIIKTFQTRIDKHYSATQISIIPLGKKQAVDYYCDHSANHIKFPCMDREGMATYHNKYARVGWYKKDDVLWFHNPHPQLVSLEVDGKVVTSYEESLKFAKNRIDTFSIIVYIF